MTKTNAVPKPVPKAGPRLIAERHPAPPGPAPRTAPSPPQPDTIGTYIALEIEARQCADLDSLRFALTNSPGRISGCDKAFLAEPHAGGGWHVTCASSVHKIDRHAPLVRFVNDWLNKAAFAPAINAREPRFADLQADAGQFALEGECPPFPHAFWLPVKTRSGDMPAVLLSLKEQPWRPQTVSLMIPLAAAYGHAWAALQPAGASPARRIFRLVGKARLALGLAAVLGIAAFIPVPMSSLAPAEIVAREPALVTAPIDGVIADILQPPGATVEKDTPLVAFVDVTLRNDWEVARRNKDVAQARYFKAVQKATSMQKEMEEVAIAKAELDVAGSELRYAEEVLGRTVIKAGQAGLLVYAGKADWIGRPVKTGERIMEIADPARTEIRIEAPVSDAISVSEGGRVALFLDGDPLTAIHAGVTRTSYRPVKAADNQLVYRVHAAFDDGQPRRIGLRGVARVSSGKVPLAFYLFRRPIAALRQRFGL